MVESRDLEGQSEWWGQFFDVEGKEMWDGLDALKGVVSEILDVLDVKGQFRHAIWHTIDWHSLMDSLAARFSAWMLESESESSPESE